LTKIGDAEWKTSKSGKEALLGADKLMRKLDSASANFEAAIESLDKEKNYILRGDEEFLIRLGISSRDGRIHDKKQGKFRQINRFLEHIEDVYESLPKDGDLTVYDLCCGKSYLSFAVYYYLTAVKGRRVNMLGIDLKRDVILWCEKLAMELGFTGMKFMVEDVTKTPSDVTPDMVISLHACDIATDIVINTAVRLGARVILSTPCCHRYLNDKVSADPLGFVTKYPHLRNKLCEALTDAIRAARLESHGYAVSVMELTDPDDTPKNTLIRAIKRAAEAKNSKENYDKILSFVLGDGKDDYLKGI
jgi:SAM-dependent methyltransferase